MIPVDGKECPPDVCIIELGGTIGNLFLKTARFRFFVASSVYKTEKSLCLQEIMNPGLSLMHLANYHTV